MLGISALRIRAALEKLVEFAAKNFQAVEKDCEKARSRVVSIRRQSVAQPILRVKVRYGTTLIAAVNSDVPDVPVAVAVTTEPGVSEPGKSMLNAALPLPLVVTFTAPTHVWPSPKPEASAAGLEKKSMR